MNKIRQSYETVAPADELRDKTLEHILLRAGETDQSKGEITMKKHIRMTKTAAVIAASVAAIAMAVTAGAAATGFFHKESVDAYLGDGAADELQEQGMTSGKVILTGNSVENAYFRITVDAVLSDGDSAQVFITKERLTDERLGVVTDDGVDTDWVQPEFEMEDGTPVRNSGFGYDRTKLPEDGVTTQKYEINGIDPEKGLVLDFTDHHLFLDMMDSLTDEERQAVFDRPDYDQFHEDYIHPYYVQGLRITVDVHQNFEAVTFVDEQGRQLTATPYRIYTNDYELYDGGHNGIVPFTLHFISPGQSQAVGIADGSDDWDATEQKAVTHYYNLDEVVKDFDQVTEIRIDNIGTFTRQ